MLTLPGDFSVPAATPTGATVTYSASAADAVDGPVAVNCDHPSGSFFPIGATAVNCAASDAAGNEAANSFTVTVIAAPAVDPLVGAVGFDTGSDEGSAPNTGHHSCVVLADTTVACMGLNWFGALGIGSTLPSTSPRAVTGLTGAVDVAAGGDHSCALLASGEVTCWGRGDRGQLGDGTFVTWYVPKTVQGINNAVAISAGQDFTCALLSTNTVKCWGANSYGQLGNGTNVDSAVPTLVLGRQDITQIDSGWGHSCARAGTGVVECWGAGGSSQLGTGSLDDWWVPISPLALANVVEVQAGYGSGSCARLVDDTYKCWGGVTGQISLPSTQVVPVGTVEYLRYGFGTCVRLIDGAVRCENYWDQNGYGAPLELAPGVFTATELVGSEGSACAVLADSRISCWGHNTDAELGVGSRDRVDAPTLMLRAGPLDYPDAAEVVISNNPCALVEGGVVKCWGEVLGGDESRRDGLAAVVQGLGPVERIFEDAAPGKACALLTTGGVQCWGFGASLEAGPLLAGAEDPVALASGGSFDCVVRNTGAVQCQGVGTLGQLGNGEFASSIGVFVDVSGISDAVSVAAGWDTACAVRSNGAVACWGSNEHGLLGTARTEPYWAVPTDISGITDATSISMSSHSACVTRSGGGVQCWGDNPDGNLGDGTTTDTNSPVSAIGVTNATAVRASTDHSCALLLDGTVKCWGLNDRGQIGDGTQTNALVPVAVVGLSGVTGLSVGAFASCASVLDGRVMCWGRNTDYQQGNMNTVHNFVPAEVAEIG